MQQGKLRPLLTPRHIPSVLPRQKTRKVWSINIERYYIPEIMKFNKTIFHILSPVGRSLSLLGGRKLRWATSSDQTLSPPPLSTENCFCSFPQADPTISQTHYFPWVSHSLEAWLLLPPSPLTGHVVSQ